LGFSGLGASGSALNTLSQFLFFGSFNGLLHSAHSLGLGLRLVSLALVTLLGVRSSSGLRSFAVSFFFLSLAVRSSASLSSEDGLLGDFSHSLGLSHTSLLLGLFFVTAGSSVGTFGIRSTRFVLLFVIGVGGGGGLGFFSLLSLTSLSGLGVLGLGGGLLGRALGLAGRSGSLASLSGSSTLGSSSISGFTGAGSLARTGGLSSRAGLGAGRSLGSRSLGGLGSVSGGVLSELVGLQESLAFLLSGSHSSGSLDASLLSLGGGDGRVVVFLGDGVLGGLGLVSLRRRTG